MPEEAHTNEPTGKSLEKLTIKELREVAAEIPHERAIHDMKKDELIAFIKEARGIKEETPAKKKKKVVRVKMTKPELKARIRELKALRGEALESDKHKKADLLRHQISRLKKKSRRMAGIAAA